MLDDVPLIDASILLVDAWDVESSLSDQPLLSSLAFVSQMVNCLPQSSDFECLVRSNSDRLQDSDNLDLHSWVE